MHTCDVISRSRGTLTLRRLPLALATEADKTEMKRQGHRDPWRWSQTVAERPEPEEEVTWG